jgi:hypothetical protein
MIQLFYIFIIFTITYLWNRFLLTRLVNLLSCVKNSEENYTETNFFLENKRDIIRYASIIYYGLALFVSVKIYF